MAKQAERSNNDFSPGWPLVASTVKVYAAWTHSTYNKLRQNSHSPSLLTHIMHTYQTEGNTFTQVLEVNVQLEWMLFKYNKDSNVSAFTIAAKINRFDLKLARLDVCFCLSQTHWGSRLWAQKTHSQFSISCSKYSIVIHYISFTRNEPRMHQANSDLIPHTDQTQTHVIPRVPRARHLHVDLWKMNVSCFIMSLLYSKRWQAYQSSNAIAVISLCFIHAKKRGKY